MRHLTNLPRSTTFTASTVTDSGSCTESYVDKGLVPEGQKNHRECSRCCVFCVQTCWTDFCLMVFLLMLGEYSSFVEFVWVVWFQVMTSFVCHWWCMSLNVSSSGTDKPQNLVGWQAMKMIRAMWFTLFGSILRHWHSNIAAGCNASKEISSAMRRCPVIRWLHVLRSKISLHSLGVFLDIFLIMAIFWILGGFVTITNLQ